jgi:hypothetical protein
MLHGSRLEHRNDALRLVGNDGGSSAYRQRRQAQKNSWSRAQHGHGKLEPRAHGIRTASDFITAPPPLRSLSAVSESFGKPFSGTGPSRVTSGPNLAPPLPAPRPVTWWCFAFRQRLSSSLQLKTPGRAMVMPICASLQLMLLSRLLIFWTHFLFSRTRGTSVQNLRPDFEQDYLFKI